MSNEIRNLEPKALWNNFADLNEVPDDAWAARPSTIDVLLCAVMALAAMSSARPKVRALNKPGFRFPTVSPSFRTLILVSFLF